MIISDNTPSHHASNQKKLKQKDEYEISFDLSIKEDYN